MLRFFPTSFVDETLYSRMARYHRLTGHSVDRDSLHELIRVHTHVITSQLPSLITVFVAQLPSDAGYSAEQVIRENTLFRYFTAFMPAERSAIVLTSMLGSSVSGLKMFLGLTASRLGGRNKLRYCPRCRDVNSSACGQTYWHRVHQLPGVWVCPIHEEPLYELDNEVVQLNRQKLLLPDDPYATENAVQFVLSNTQHEALLRISRLSETILLGTMSRPDSVSINALHRLNAAEHGLIDSSGRIVVQSLIQMLESYSTEMPATDEYAALRNKMLDWSLRLLRKPRGYAAHPLKHILLLDCFRSRSCKCAPLKKQAELRSAAPKSKQLHVNVDPDRLVELLKVQNGTLSRAAAALGISVTTVAVAAARAGLKVGRRPKHITDQLKYDASASLRSGLSPREVANILGISLVSVYRILRMDQELEKDYEQKRFCVNRDAYRSRFHISHSDKAAYAWLRRNDNQWLAEQIRLKKKTVTRTSSVDWSLRDRVHSQQIIQAEANIRRALGKPKHISRALLLRMSGIGTTLERNLERLPLTSSALELCAESSAAYQCRRLKWAFAELEKQLPCSPPRWQLLRLAGIRKLSGENERLVQALTSSSFHF